MVFDELAAGKIARELVERSIYYDQVAERIHYMPLLEALLDSNDTIFKYNEHVQKNSKIRAEFLLKNHMEGRNLFLFIDRDCAEKYFCRSFFRKAPEISPSASQGLRSCRKQRLIWQRWRKWFYLTECAVNEC